MLKEFKARRKQETPPYQKKIIRYCNIGVLIFCATGAAAASLTPLGIPLWITIVSGAGMAVCKAVAEGARQTTFEDIDPKGSSTNNKIK